MKISILDSAAFSIPESLWEGFEAIGEVVMWPSTQPEETVSHIGDAQAVITCNARITAADVKACPNVKYIGVLGDYCSMLELGELQKMGISITNVQDWNAEFTAQHTLKCMMSVLSPERPDLAGLTVGLIGNGDSARILAECLHLLGAEIIVHEKAFNMAFHRGVTKYVMDIEEFLPRCDIISVHRPFLALPQHPYLMRGIGGLTDLRGFIDADKISKMKSGVILIDTFGFGSVDMAAARTAKESGKVLEYICSPVPASPFSQERALARGIRNLMDHINGIAEYVW